jgi:hypothetical protein
MKHEIRVLEELGSEFERIALKRRRRGFVGVGRWRPLALIAVLVLGGASAALAAAGVFQTGAPITTQPGYAPVASVGWGAPRAGSMRLLALRVPDPAGGPPWGLGMFETTQGLACAVTGRVVNGRLGALGTDYAFADDGRFHPLLPAAGIGLDCSPPDARGAVFLTGSGWLESASGEVAVAAAIGQRPACRFPGDQSPGLRCSQTDLRTVYYGFLGPDARSISYASDGARHVEDVTRPDGGYLVVVPAPAGVTRGRAAKYGDILPPVRVDVTYNSGRTCTLQQTNPGASAPNPCQAVGYAEGPLDLPSHSELATPARASYSPTATVGLLAPGPTITVRFTARFAITNSRYSYTTQLTPPATRACRRALARDAGIPLQASTHGTIRARQTVRLLVSLQPLCAGRYTGHLYLHRAPRWNLHLAGMNRLGVNQPANVTITTFAVNAP